MVTNVALRHPQVLMLCVMTSLLSATLISAQEKPTAGKSPADDLPDYITRLTHFGERADWSHDGKKILFLEKTFGDAYEVEIATRIIRPATSHYYHEGYVRALYLANGDILLSGAREFNADNPGPSRGENAELWVLDKSLAKPPVRLGMKCSEGPAVSRKNMRIAWTLDHGDYPDRMPAGVSQIWMGDIEYEKGISKLVNQKLVLDSRTLPFKCGLECQNWIPPDEKALTFSAYGYQGTDVMGINLATGKVVNYSEAPDEYDEPEGIFPDGKYTLVECDRQNRKGSQYVDIWKLWLDGSHRMERVTYFSDYPGYKASNPVVSDDGRYMAFQMAKVGDPAGVGRGIFVYDFQKAKTRN
jgi:Tol biopolymer transport system component